MKKLEVETDYFPNKHDFQTDLNRPQNSYIRFERVNLIRLECSMSTQDPNSDDQPKNI